jgi:hypothetical protein
MWDLSEEDLFKDVAKQEIDDIVSSAKYSLTQYNIPEVMKNRISLIKSKSSDETCILHPDFCNKVGLMLGLNKFWVVLTPDLKGLFIGHIKDHVHAHTSIPLYICNVMKENEKVIVC